MTPDQTFAAIAEELLADPRISVGKMFGSSGLRIRGKVFAMVVKGKLVVKLPEERVDAFVAAGAGERFDPGHGRLMKEWVAIGPSRAGEWPELAEEARDFVGRAIQ